MINNYVMKRNQIGFFMFCTSHFITIYHINIKGTSKSTELLRVAKMVVIDRKIYSASLLDNETYNQLFNLLNLFSCRQKYCSSTLFLKFQLVKLKQSPKTKSKLFHGKIITTGSNLRKSPHQS